VELVKKVPKRAYLSRPRVRGLRAHKGRQHRTTANLAPGSSSDLRRASRKLADMPLLTLYINNKAGGLIYHRVSDPLDPAHTPALPTPSRARFSVPSQAEPKPSPKPSPISRVAGLFQGGRETRHQRAAAASVHLQRPRDDYEGALARAALGPHGAARGRLVCPAIL